mgnify:CR=1 FL=1
MKRTIATLGVVGLGYTVRGYAVLREERAMVRSWLDLAASLEQGSEHPLATAVVAGAAGRGLRLEEAREFRSETGLGAEVGTGVGLTGRPAGKAPASAM